MGKGRKAFTLPLNNNPKKKNYFRLNSSYYIGVDPKGLPQLILKLRRARARDVRANTRPRARDRVIIGVDPSGLPLSNMR